MPQIVPIKELKNTNRISQMCHESHEPIYVTKNGYGDMVIMSMEAYERQMVLAEAEAKLAAAEEQVAAGNVLDAKKAFAALREKYGV
ncbi:type II toxin-antitoxin system Phd/YefM family antitoxin [Candidatus Allofournierella merdavium]|uniref:type II toxin-antitoxin system Phd/YefM family antitoxin n=1 Tax=Allofournierella TaxID=1940255 RepID=UPI001F8F6A58|nr:type II toxin-antitoxin system Phd/YefM family antitoxin [Candidatus Fournierella excrementigallinarum]